MGKHDEKKVFSWDPPKDQFDKERNKVLALENINLKRRIVELERQIAQDELAEEQGEHVRRGVIAEFEAEIRKLTDENVRLREALVRAMIGD